MPPVLTNRFAEAFAYAATLHARQSRKGTDVPYLSHLMSVAALVLEDGGDEDEAIAGLLHDAVEDQGGKPTLEEIRRLFGEKVARIVDGCTDSDVTPKPPWRERKERYVGHLRQAAADVRRVSSADKVHNARSILTDYRVMGDALWSRFTAGKEETLWYYRSLLDAFRVAGGGRLVEELDLLVNELERLSRRMPTVKGSGLEPVQRRRPRRRV
jgi:(p)ppGpp synthase/HD superfamily hydrolase